VSTLRSFDGSEPTATYGHTGWPVDLDDVLDRARRGLPSYWPTDPVSIQQAGYREFAGTRGPNSE
jgi:hypothetical protein